MQQTPRFIGIQHLLLCLLTAPIGSRAERIAPTVRRPVPAVVAELNASFTGAWRASGLAPSPPAVDTVFVRRAYLDLIGRIPSADEVTAFLAIPGPRKRDMLVDDLLSGPEYAEYWANQWCIRLVGRRTLFRDRALYLRLYDWLELALTENRGFAEMTTALLTASGGSDAQPEVAFLSHWSESLENLTGQVGKVFLGVRLQCAQCHDHPYEQISQQAFWETAAFFAGLKAVRPDAEGIERQYRLQQTPVASVPIPDKDKRVTPRFVVGETPAIRRPDDRRTTLAAILVAPDNPYFAKATVNWIWSQMLGSGLVNPVEDMSLGQRNPAQVPAAMALLANDFRDSGYDLQRLLRIIVGSAAYQLSTRPSSNNEWDYLYFSRAHPRPMSPEQLFNSVVQVADLDQVIESSMHRGKRVGDQLSRLQRELRSFVYLYDDDEMGEAISFQGTIPQALFMMNSPVSNNFLTSPGSRLARMAETRRNRRSHIDEMFLSILSRPPSTRESRRCRSHLRRADYDLSGYQDVAWAMLNTTEFFYIH